MRLPRPPDEGQGDVLETPGSGVLGESHGRDGVAAGDAGEELLLECVVTQRLDQRRGHDTRAEER